MKCLPRISQALKSIRKRIMFASSAIIPCHRSEIYWFGYGVECPGKALIFLRLQRSLMKFELCNLGGRLEENWISYKFPMQEPCNLSCFPMLNGVLLIQY